MCVLRVEAQICMSTLDAGLTWLMVVATDFSLPARKTSLAVASELSFPQDPLQVG